MIRFALYITERQLAVLRAASRKTGLSVAELIRRAIDLIAEKK